MTLRRAQHRRAHARRPRLASWLTASLRRAAKQHGGWTTRGVGARQSDVDELIALGLVRRIVGPGTVTLYELTPAGLAAAREQGAAS